MQNKADPQKAERLLDEPLPDELTAEERKRAEMRRIADANRAAMVAIETREKGARLR